MLLSEAQRRDYTEYCKANKAVFSDRVVLDFFQRDEHIVLLLGSLDGDGDCQRELEERFRKHFFRIRFVKFLVSTIKFCMIDQMRLHQKNDRRYQLIIDRPASDEGDGTIGELLFTQEARSSERISSDPTEFQGTFTNENLAKAFSLLTPKQQLITTFGYSLCYQDNEIARIIGVSPQAIGKTRKLALRRLRLAMPERR